MLELPAELLVHVFGMLDARSLLRCRKVCRALESVIDGSVELQYKIELGLAGMVDGPLGGKSLQYRLDALRAFRAAWKNGAHPIHDMWVSSMCSWRELRGTIVTSYKLGWSGSAPGVRVPPAPFCGTVGWSRSISGWAEMTASRPGWGVIEVDIGQDLLVCLWYNCYVQPEVGTDQLDVHVPQVSLECSFFSLGEDLAPHPLARRSTIMYLLPDRAGAVPSDLQILGDLVLWTVSPNVGVCAEIRVINWKTGITVWHVQAPSGPTKITLLTNTLLLMYGATNSLLKLYSFDPASHEDCVYSTLDATPVACTLRLPEPREGAFPWGSIRCFIEHPSSVPPHERPSFTPDPELTVLVMSIRTAVPIPVNDQRPWESFHEVPPTPRSE